jgi:hypothetical protein
MSYFRFGLGISKFDIYHYRDWNLVIKEVTNIEVNKMMIYLLEVIMHGNELVKKH